MTDTSVSRPGQSNLAGDVLAQFLKVFTGEVITTFEELNVMRGVMQSRTITSGKSAQFPVHGRAAAFFHTVGKNIADVGSGLLSLVPATERIINVDNRLISAVSIAEIDEAMNHYDVRSIYSEELGRALSKRFDQLALNTFVLASRAIQPSAFTAQGILGGGLNGAGAPLTDANVATQGVALSNALFTCAQKFDERDVPKTDRYAAISPAMYYNLIRDPLTTQVTVNPAITTNIATGVASSGFPLLAPSGPNGSYAKGTIYECAGFTLLKTNHLPNTIPDTAGGGGTGNVTSADAFFGTPGASANGNVYYGNFVKTRGVAFHKSAGGLLKLRDLATESEWKMEYQGWLTLAKMVIGMNILRPESSIELAIP
jgi:hypothetical protein